MVADSAKIHEEKYRTAKAAGHSGWGGTSRIANLPEVIEKRFFGFEKSPRSGRFLEIGCGAGNVSLEFARRGFEVDGVDFSETAIAWARENAGTNGLAANFHLANVTNLSLFANDSFDVIYDGNCLHCLIGGDRGKALAEIKRVLKPNGMFFVSSRCFLGGTTPPEFDRDAHVLFELGAPYRFIPSPDFLTHELVSAGFQISRREVRSELPFGHLNLHAVKTALPGPWGGV